MRTTAPSVPAAPTVAPSARSVRRGPCSWPPPPPPPRSPPRPERPGGGHVQGRRPRAPMRVAGLPAQVADLRADARGGHHLLLRLHRARDRRRVVVAMDALCLAAPGYG